VHGIKAALWAAAYSWLDVLGSPGRLYQSQIARGEGVGGHWQVNRVWRSDGCRERLRHEGPSSSYPRHRVPAEIISHAVWLYHVFSLSLRDVELILAERSVIVSHESVRHWCRKFGAEFALKAAEKFAPPYSKTRTADAQVQVGRPGAAVPIGARGHLRPFRPRRHLVAASRYRRARTRAFRIRSQETCIQMAA
jgi:putative transposase